MKSLLLSLLFAAALVAQVRIACDYDGDITPSLAIHFQASAAVGGQWNTVGVVTNVQPFDNSVPVTLTPPMMFFRAVASNEWGIASSNTLTSAPPQAVRLKIR